MFPILELALLNVVGWASVCVVAGTVILVAGFLSFAVGVVVFTDRGTAIATKTVAAT